MAFILLKQSWSGAKAGGDRHPACTRALVGSSKISLLLELDWESVQAEVYKI